MELHIILVLTLLNLGLVIAALKSLAGLRKDLRTPVVKKFNSDFKRRPVEIPAENSARPPQRDDKFQQNRNNQQNQNRPKNNIQNRPQQVRRPAARVPEVFSNEPAAAANAAPIAPPPPRPTAESAPQAPVNEGRPSFEGRRPLPPRFNDNTANAPAAPAFNVAPIGTAAPDLAGLAPAPISPVINDDAGQEYDRTKQSFGRRNSVKKAIVDDGAEE
ncbi:hypothetical protein AGMMS49938_05380 [Fibrobacterales bacterium]|nr:hypothetical protein AGMMS49938_05380 [Fibrobacterales bacterium]